MIENDEREAAGGLTSGDDGILERKTSNADSRRSGVNSESPETRAGDQRIGEEKENSDIKAKDELLEVKHFNDLSLSQREKYLEESVADCLSKDFGSINYLDLKKKFPKAIKEYEDYVQSKAISEVGKIDEDMHIGSMLYSPRTIIYQFFDNLGMYIFLEKIPDTKSEWKGTINDNNGVLLCTATGTSNRSTIENQILYGAFGVLESTL